MKQETVTIQVTPKARTLAKQVAALTEDKVYNVVEKALQSELDKIQGK